MLKFKDELNTKLNIHTTKSFLDGKQICICKICVNPEKNTWNISTWNTNNTQQKKGYGHQTLQHALQTIYDKIGPPKEIRYIWDGVHPYIMNWLKKHFKPIKSLSLTNQNDILSEWDAHTYILNTEKTLKYFKIKKGKK